MNDQPLRHIRVEFQMAFFKRPQQDWTGFEKLILIGFAPALQFLAWLYVHFVSSRLHLSNANTIELIIGFVCNFSPIVLLPLWGWGLTLLFFYKPNDKKQ
jgi:hypothetical protein